MQEELAQVARDAEHDADAVHRYLAAMARPTRRARTRLEREQAVSAAVRRQMAAAAFREARLRTVSGVRRGRVRFNLVNGWIAQRLLFRRGLERKPVSLALFRVVWPLLWQRRLLMPLVEPKGIYCFYSRRFLRQVVGLIAERRTLEIGAGDGTLARFLADEGVSIVATDDYSWSPDVTYPENVRRQPAKEALAVYRPQVVICSWPPPANDFERHVFRTPSVELYVVISSRSRYAAGDWSAYERQHDFAMAEAKDLGRGILPPEVDPAVYVFRRGGA